jgi:hypothetical protein
MIQAQRFPNGGYVGHKVRVNSNVSPMHFSVWFSEQGELLDCEAFDKAGRARPVPPKVRKVLATMYGWIVAASRQQA